MRRKTVMLVDDHEIYRCGLRELLSPSFDIIAEAWEGSAAVEQALSQRPDVVVMDVGLPGMDGIEATRQIKQALPDTSVVIVSASDDPQRIFDAIEAGVSGYVAKDDRGTAVTQAVEHASEGRAYLPAIIAKRVFEGIANHGPNSGSGGAAQLSSRELSVLRLIALGRRNRDIADELCVSERTVGNHITSIYNKLAVFDRAAAIVYAIKKGIVRI